jgi:tetratricopeptide (TPR) repeat protein
MPGRVLTEVFEDLPDPQRIAAYDPSTGSSTGGEDGGAMDEALVEKLRSLGYIGGGAPKADRNLATLHLRAGEYRKAAQIYHRLLEEDPDNPGLNTDFATAMAGLERFAEALQALERALSAVPDYAPAYYRRGAVAEAQGERVAAVADYRRALRYDPDLQGPRQALERLGESVVEQVARTPEEVRSAELLQQAQELARRGGYEEAWKLLLEAESLTPDASVVYQYKGNVAFLRGDRGAAVAALKKALELDPEDARIRENLRRLQEGG